MSSKGKYIVVEGADGSGKTTAANLLKAQLQALGKPTLTVNILKDDPVALMVRGILTDPKNTIHPDAEIALYAAAVTNTYHHHVRPLLERGINVICDRNQISTWAYQVMPQLSAGNTRPKAIFEAAYDDLRPDLLVGLFVDSQVGLDRAKARDGKHDRLELRGVEYQQQVQEAYRNYCDSVASRQTVVVYQNDAGVDKLEDFIRAVAQAI